MRIYNSISQKREIFIPLKKGKVSMYVCGITPYDITHLGHAFVYNFFDVLKRYLEYKNYNVVYTQNVTDIDDDILKRAKRDNVDWKKLGEFWTKKYLDDLKTLNLSLPNNYAKATDHIETVITIIEKLIKEGFAYIINETVYFNISKTPDYGNLSKLSTQEMVRLSKARGANPDDPQKINPLDFILWQKRKKGEPYWDTPWGKGRPGWHIECSSMIHDTLGDQIDIHGGGADLIFPHHESEKVQSESFTKKIPFVKYWMHVGMLHHEKEKMSKSLKNLVLISDLLKKYSPNSIRWLLLSHHYRDEWEYEEKDISDAQSKINLLNDYLKAKKIEFPIDEKVLKKFENLMDYDFNTPKVLELLVDLHNKVKNDNKSISSSISKMMLILGFA